MMRKGGNLSGLLLGTKLFLVCCFCLINAFVVSESKASNNKEKEETLKKQAVGDWADVTLSEKWHLEENHGDTIRFALEDHSSRLTFYRLKGKSTSVELKEYIVQLAGSYGIPTYYRAINNQQLERSNAIRGGFCQGTVLDQSAADSVLVENEDGSIISETNENEKQVIYLVLAGLQSDKGVYVLEARTRDMENIPMSISRAQRNWVLR